MNNLKIVVIGGTGLIGSKLIQKLSAQGYEAVAAAPETGVNTLTGEGLEDVVQNASVLVDVSNSPSFEEKAVMDFFTTSTRNLLAAASKAGVKHYVALSVVGTDRVPDSPYLRAKLTQEDLIRAASIPYSIVHATQFFEFAVRIADSAMVGNEVHLPPISIQPMAGDDVAKAVGRAAVGPPVNGVVEIGGPDRFSMPDFVREGLRARNDMRVVVADPKARYFDANPSDLALVPAAGAQLAETHFQQWLGPVVAQK